MQNSPQWLARKVDNETGQGVSFFFNRLNLAGIQQTGGFGRLVLAGESALPAKGVLDGLGYGEVLALNRQTGYALKKAGRSRASLIGLVGLSAADALEALGSLLPQLGAHDALVLDEAWCFLNERFQLGECPAGQQAFGHLPALQAALETRKDTHRIIRSLADRGYVLLVPTALLASVKDWFYLLPTDPNPKVLQLKGNVPGVTSISILRRAHDARFATRYFKGHGLDVGGGNDSLALYLEFFPLVTNLIVYEQEQGDGQYLANVPNDAFDFLYSSHCLEHLRDPRVALKNWLRVTRRGGHLVFQIPDEDLYEQGVWPSRFNTDHKHTFTIAKAQSWSPVSLNVLDLVSELREYAKVLSIAQVDHGVRSRILGKGVDQTRFPMAECGIEVVLQKL